MNGASQKMSKVDQEIIKQGSRAGRELNKMGCG